MPPTRGQKRRKTFKTSERAKLFRDRCGRLIRKRRDLSNGSWYYNSVTLLYGRELREYGDVSMAIKQASIESARKRSVSLGEYKTTKRGKKVVEFIESERKRVLLDTDGVVRVSE